MAETDLSIIIVNWNTAHLLENCLRSVSFGLGASDLSGEVIVIDNGSTDGSLDLVASKYPEAQLIRNTDNIGFARANNQGLRVAQGQYCLLLNSDTEVLGSALSTMVRFLGQTTSAGVVGARLVNADGSRQKYTCGLAPLPAWEVWYQYALSRTWPSNPNTKRTRMARWTYDVPFEVDWVGGAALMIRREAMTQAGLLDEDFFMYTEDVEWCYRVKQNGWRIFYLPEANIYHLNRGSSQNTAGFVYHWARAGYLLFHQKHYGALSALGLRLFWSVVGTRFDCL